MKVRSYSAPAFSLFLEVAFALGVAVFCLIAMFGNYKSFASRKNPANPWRTG